MHRTGAMRVTWVVLAVLSFACGGGSDSSSPTEPARRDSLTLVSVEPAQGSSVRLDGSFQVRARFRYTFENAAGGKIVAFLIPLPPQVPLLTDPFPAEVAVQGPAGEAALSFGVLQLDPGLRPSSMLVSFTLFREGQSTSNTNVEVRYEVEP